MGGRRSRYWCGPGFSRETKLAAVRRFTGQWGAPTNFRGRGLKAASPTYENGKELKRTRATIKLRQNLTPAAPDILARIVSRKQDELQCVKTTRRRTAPTRRIRTPRPPRLRRRPPRQTPRHHLRNQKSIPQPRRADRRFPPRRTRPAIRKRRRRRPLRPHRSRLLPGLQRDLQTARAACNLPVIRKDFTIAEYHVLEAAAIGADAILLIAAILDESPAPRLPRTRRANSKWPRWSKSTTPANSKSPSQSGAEIIGVNNRDLRTFNVSLETSIALAPQIPPALTKVSESGIFTAADIHKLLDAGYDAFLVGEHLIKSGDATRALQELVS